MVAKSVEPDEMLPYAAFHLGLYCLPKTCFCLFDFCGSFMFFFCFVFAMSLCVCLYVPCGHLLGKG